MKLYRFDHLIVEALQVTWENRLELEIRYGAHSYWCPEVVDSEMVLLLIILVETNWGVPTAEEGDWIVRNEFGAVEHYTQQEFNELFEPA